MYKIRKTTSIWIKQISVHGFSVKKKIMINKELELLQLIKDVPQDGNTSNTWFVKI